MYIVAFSSPKIEGDIDPSVKKMILAKWVNLSIFVCVDSISFKLKNNFLKLDPQRRTIYQIDGNSMRILMDLTDLK